MVNNSSPERDGDRFKLHTGAEVTAISKSVYENLRDVKLQPSLRSLYGPTCQPLKVLGQFEATLARSEDHNPDYISH